MYEKFEENLHDLIVTIVTKCPEETWETLSAQLWHNKELRRIANIITEAELGEEDL